MEEYCEKHGGLGINQFELDGCPGCLWETIQDELRISREGNKIILLSLTRAVDLLRELQTGINVLATICDVEGLWGGMVRANEMKKDLDMFFGEREELPDYKAFISFNEPESGS